MSTARLRVTHVIAGLELGGAEMMLYKLLSLTDRASFEPRVISLTDFGPLAPRIAELGIPVSALGMPRGRVRARPLGHLGRTLAADRPQIVQTWMYHADLLGGTLARVLGAGSVIWGVRGSLDPKLSKRSARITASACAVTSRWLPDRIVSCSQRLADMHVDLGYDRERMLVIPNGFDLTRFRPDAALGSARRAQLGLPADAQLVGVVGRFHPQKDHRTFALAAGVVARAREDVHFVLCGPGVDAANQELLGWLAQAGVARDRCTLLGAVDDTPALLNALDLLVCSSAFGEGFPNVLGEGMACGVPCVTTDVGDAAAIVVDTGRVVPPADPQALARAVLAVLALPWEEREELSKRARARVQEHFALGGVVARFEALYRELCAQRALA